MLFELAKGGRYQSLHICGKKRVLQTIYVKSLHACVCIEEVWRHFFAWMLFFFDEVHSVIVTGTCFTLSWFTACDYLRSLERETCILNTTVSVQQLLFCPVACLVAPRPTLAPAPHSLQFLVINCFYYFLILQLLYLYSFASLQLATSKLEPL